MAKRFHERVFDVVARIPRGRVASYKLVGTLAGSPNAARHVGRVMRLGKGLPWWRVIAASKRRGRAGSSSSAKDGRIVIMNPQFRYEQILRLREEGIEVSDEGVVDYERWSWKPLNSAKPPARKAAAKRPRPARPRGRRSR